MKRKRVSGHVQSRNPTANGLQMKLDHVWFAMSHPIRVSIMKFLNRAEKNNFGMQSFTAIQRSLERYLYIVTPPNLTHHLNELKNVEFIKHLEGEGYSLTDLGRKLVEVYFELENIHSEKDVFSPNVLEEYPYNDHIYSYFECVNHEIHMTDIDEEGLAGDDMIGNFNMFSLDDGDTMKRTRVSKKKPASAEEGTGRTRGERRPGNLDSFL